MSQHTPRSCQCYAHLDGSIVYCLLHAAAPEMFQLLSVLEMLAQNIIVLSKGFEPDQDKELKDFAIQAHKRARALLAKVGGENE